MLRADAFPHRLCVLAVALMATLAGAREPDVKLPDIGSSAAAILSPQDLHDYGAEMLAFWLEHRLAVVVLLDRAQGSAYERYGERFVTLLVKSTLAQIRAGRPNVPVGAPARLVLTQIFEGTRRALASILAHTDDPRALREAIEAFWSYQIPGLQGFARWLRKE
jgi:hypothetical protein